jgi:glycosyltransferase involved in cell wall biosynthesis
MQPTPREFTADRYMVSIVVPCFNEEGNLAELHGQLCKALEACPHVEFLFVDDGSTDGTWAVLQQLAANDKRVRPLALSRNFGHQFALKAGMDNAVGDCVISLDADLQHPPELIPALLAKWRQGFEVVYTVRADDPHLPWHKRVSSKLFYALMRRLSSVDIHPGAADFRLLDKAVVEVLRSCGENHLFIRGLVSWAGFNQTAITYAPNARFAGTTQYSLRKMVAFALSGITAFSIRPLQLSIFLGLFIAALAGVYGLYVIYIFSFTDKAIPGWASITASVLFIGGIQLIMLGIIGEYIGKTFIENKKRPSYILRKPEGQGEA